MAQATPGHEHLPPQHLVLLGGGHAHAVALAAFAAAPPPGTRITLVSREAQAPYSGMLPGLIAGHYGFHDAHIDLRRLAERAGADFVHDEAVGIDPRARQVLLAGRPALRYDILSINIGARPDMAQVPGAAEHAIAVKPIDRLLARLERVRADIAARRGTAHAGTVRIGVVGAGAGGTELILALHHALGRHRRAEHGADPPLSFHLICDTSTLLPDHNGRVRRIFTALSARRGIMLHAGCKVVRVDEAGVVCACRGRIALDHVFWATAAAAPAWLRRSGLALDEKGFIAVDAGLRSLSHDAVFAAGDIAAMSAHPRPKAGVFAVRQGGPLATNLRRAIAGEALRPFVPQRRHLSLIGTGDRCAVASWGPVALKGRWVWRWKEWIDRRFMRRFQD